MKILMRAMNEVPVKMIQPARWKDLLTSLTFKVSSGASIYGGSSKDDEVTEVKLFSLRGDSIHVPRFHNVRPYLKNPYNSASSEDLYQIDHAFGEPAIYQSFIELKKEPRRHQVNAVTALIHHECGILAAATGKGKTVMAIAAAHRIGRRAVIVVPTDHLLSQWVERITQMTSLTVDDIGVIRGPRIEIDRPVIVAMVQTLSRRDYETSTFDSVGLLICDEVHRMGAPEWIRTVCQFRAARRIGLSATPSRRDGMDAAFKLHIGPTVFEMLDPDVTPRVCVVRTGTTLPRAAYENRWNGQVNLSKLHTLITQDRRRNTIIVTELRNAYDASRKVLALSRRLEHLEEIRRMLLPLVPVKAIGVINSFTKSAERSRILAECRIILAIEKIAGEGLDQPDLDTLFWMSPIQSVEQNIGRIVREYPDKKQPLALDFVDDIEIFTAMSRSRRKVYSANGYEIVDLDKRSAYPELKSNAIW